MPRPATGELRRLSSGWEARIRVGEDGKRRGFALLPSLADGEAATRCRTMADIARRLRLAGHANETPQLLKMAALARPGRPWEAVVAAVDALCAGQTEGLSAASRVTFEAFGKEWRSGKLHERYPDHVPPIDHTRNEQMARLYVDPVIGNLLVSEISLDDADEVMARLPSHLASASRRHVAQYVRRVLALSVYPGRLRTTHPIPKGWLPRLKDAKAKECLYPEEDRALLACPLVPLIRRLAYGFLCREGMRTDELARLEWRSLDLERGKVYLDENKTDDPRDWDLDPNVAEALRVWKRAFCGRPSPTDRVFSDSGVPFNVDHLAHQLRSDLKRAGVTRPQLFERSASRRPMRAHDLRATFVTVSLAQGKTETWVADRTGHTSSAMLNRYRRRARTWAGLALGALAPLVSAIPELAAAR